MDSRGQLTTAMTTLSVADVLRLARDGDVPFVRKVTGELRMRFADWVGWLRSWQSPSQATPLPMAPDTLARLTNAIGHEGGGFG